jgi:hypothetical protein
MKMENIYKKKFISNPKNLYNTAEIDITQKREVQKLDETKFEVGKISEKVEEISAEHMITVERVKLTFIMIIEIAN